MSRLFPRFSDLAFHSLPKAESWRLIAFSFSLDSLPSDIPLYMKKKPLRQESKGRAVAYEHSC